MSTGAAASGSHWRLQQTQNLADETVDIMRVDTRCWKEKKLSEWGIWWLIDKKVSGKNSKMWAIGIVIVAIIIILCGMFP
ncbi:unnamed protein product [Nyctereutes procyonoides]|uniref:(raccoon dog) hypothetical protein n=1 Tax=Nyctereutes procyonoides TaxID=34880 RepID=A0A811Z833_NYCPR|nr:unnamed protein product [Nyctereutes procyonoides]